MALGRLICYTFIMSMYFIGSTHSACDRVTVATCKLILEGPGSISEGNNNPTREQIVEACSVYNRYKGCLNSTDCLTLISSEPSFAKADALCKGLTHSACDAHALTTCTRMLNDPVFINQRNQDINNMTPEEITKVCSLYNRLKGCLNSADCLTLVFTERNIAKNDALCKGSTHSACDSVDFDSCDTNYVNGLRGLNLDKDNLTPEETTKVCSLYNRYKGCLNSADCLTLGSNEPFFAEGDALCKDYNGVSTLTPRLTFIVAIMFVVLTFTRMIT